MQNLWPLYFVSNFFRLSLPVLPRGSFNEMSLSLCSLLGMFYDFPEITPHNRKGNFRFNKDSEKVVKFGSMEVEARALIEGQFMAKRLHVERMGFKTGKISKWINLKSYLSMLQKTLKISVARLRINICVFTHWVGLKHSSQKQGENWTHFDVQIMQILFC